MMKSINDRIKNRKVVNPVLRWKSEDPAGTMRVESEQVEPDEGYDMEIDYLHPNDIWGSEVDDEWLNEPISDSEWNELLSCVGFFQESRHYHGSMLKESSDSKYELTDETMKWGGWLVLYRIRALRSFGDVKKGDKGGWVERIGNLSLSGNCWIYDNAKVFGPAKVCHDSQVRDEVEIQGYTGIYGNSKIYGNTTIGGQSSLTDVEVRGRDVKLYDVRLQGVQNR